MELIRIIKRRKEERSMGVVKRLGLVLLVLLTVGISNAFGVVGVPDDTPGKDVIAPFFLVSIEGKGNLNTLFTFTDVLGGWSNSSANVFHYSVCTQKSETVHDDYLKGTTFDIVSIDASTIISNMSKASRSKLEYDLDEDSINDVYAGYIYFEGYSESVVSSVYLCDLLAGMVASYNLPAKELNGEVVELFSANALATVENGYIETIATGFSLTPRFYIVGPEDDTYLFLWKSVNSEDKEVHILFFNADEKYMSSNLPIGNELNIIRVKDFVPIGLHGDKYPIEGWIMISLPDLYGVPKNFGDWEWLAYSWQVARGTAQEAWSVLNAAPRYVVW